MGSVVRMRERVWVVEEGLFVWSGHHQESFCFLLFEMFLNLLSHLSTIVGHYRPTYKTGIWILKFLDISCWCKWQKWFQDGRLGVGAGVVMRAVTIHISWIA